MENENDFISCPHCNKFTPKGANSYKGIVKINKLEKFEMVEKKVKTIKKTDTEKTPSLFVVCSKCGQKKFVRKDVLEKRIARFGSIEKMDKEYLCRNCKRELK